MTVHWNSRRGFAVGPNTTSSADSQTPADEARVSMAELLWVMRKVPDLRASYLARAKKLVADPGYPPPDVVKKVADLLAKKMGRTDPQ
jgi:hypothetical protein